MAAKSAGQVSVASWMAGRVKNEMYGYKQGQQNHLCKKYPLHLKLISAVK